MDQFSANTLYQTADEQGDPTVWRQRLQNAAKYDSWLERISTGECSGYREEDKDPEDLPDSPTSSDASSVPKDIFSLAELEKRKLSSNARLTSDLNSLSLTLFISTPSISICPDSIS